MRLSDRYIGRQVLVGTLFAILLLSTILVLGSVFQTIRTLLVDFGAPPSIIVEFILAAIPFSLIYTIPWAFLSAVLLVFGRLSSDNELIGFRVAGMSLQRIAMPVFAIGVGLSLLCLWLNLEITYKAKASARHIATRAFFMDPRSMLSAAAEQDGLARFEDSLKNIRAYVEKSDGSTMQGLHLFQIRPPDKPDEPNRYVHAMKAVAEIDNEKRQFRLRLTDMTYQTTTSSGTPEMVIASEAVPVVLDFTPTPVKPTPDSMSNSEIRDFIENKIPEMQALVDERVAMLKSELEALRGDAGTPERVITEKATALKKALAMNWNAIIPNYEAEIQNRYASSFACLAFAFIGIPLGIKARRKDTSTGLVLSLFIGAAYFVCGMIGGKDSTGVIIAAWTPNIICILLGLVLLRRARFR